MKKDPRPQATPPRRRVLARMLAEELVTARGGHHGGIHTFTHCPPDVCDFDLD